MGADVSTVARELARELAEERSGHSSSLSGTVSEQKRNGWDDNDCSDNISISDVRTKAERTGDRGGTVDGVRGKMTYRRGVHLIQFEWQPGTNKHVSIGVATTKAPLQAARGSQLLGANDQSIGWNLVTKQVFFNDCEIGTLPKNASGSFTVPSKVVMILNMDDGLLAFRVDDEQTDVAMPGLKRIGEKLYIAAAMDTPGDSVVIKYMGTLDSLREEQEAKVSSELKFHRTCGKKAFFGNQQSTAARSDYEDNVCDATVLTHRSLRDGELFEIRIDKKITNKKTWRNGVSLGLTTTPPSELEFARDMTKNRQGHTWLYSSNQLVYQRQSVDRVNGDIDDLEEGDRIGVKKEGKKIMFYINGSHQASLQTDVRADVYGFVDIFGCMRQVTIISAPSGAPATSTGSDDTPTLKEGHVSFRTPKTRTELTTVHHQTLRMLRDHNPDKIPRNRKYVETFFHDSISQMSKQTDRLYAAEHLAGIDDSAKIIHSYLCFLWQRGISSGSEVAACYLYLFEACSYFTSYSLQLCKQFGDVELVEQTLKAVKNFGERCSSSRSVAKLTQIWLRFLQHCVRESSCRELIAADSFYREEVKVYLQLGADNHRIVVPITIAVSFLCSDDDVMAFEASAIEHLLTVLKNAVGNKHKDGTYHFEGWFAHDIANCIAKLATSEENFKHLTKSGSVFKQLIQMTSFSEHTDQECALNALWTLLSTDTYESLVSDYAFVGRLHELKNKGSEGVKLAAQRLATKLEAQGSSRRTGTGGVHCHYKALCGEFLKSLRIPGGYLDPAYDKCYCVDCHSKRTDKAYYNRGEPPKTYAIPVGWARFGLKHPPRAAVQEVTKKWHAAYHGTKCESIAGILEVGEIVPAGAACMDGRDILERSKHFNDDRKPEGFNTKQVFLSPSIRYSGVDTYAKPSRFHYLQNGSDLKYVARVALQVFIKPESYDVGAETIGAQEDIDPGFSNQELEWSTARRGAVVLSGVLVQLREQN